MWHIVRVLSTHNSQDNFIVLKDAIKKQKKDYDYFSMGTQMRQQLQRTTHLSHLIVLSKAAVKKMEEWQWSREQNGSWTYISLGASQRVSNYNEW